MYDVEPADDVRLALRGHPEALVHLVTSSHAAFFLKDYWGLDADEVARALQWAIGVLADAIHDPERRGNL